MGLIISEPDITGENTRIRNGEWWLKDPYDTTAVLQFNPVDTGSGRLRVREKVQRAVYHPVRRKYPVVVSDAQQGVEMEMTWYFQSDDPTEASYNRLRYLFEIQRTLLLQSGWLQQQWYIAFTSDWQEDIINTDPWTREVVLTFVEVEMPHGAVV